MRPVRVILALLTVAALSSPVLADEPSRKPANVTKARQMMLKHRLQTITGGSLTAILYHNRREWESLPANERDRYRRDALAFLEKAPQDQEKLLKHYEKLIKLSAEKREEYRQRAQWLKPVVQSFTPDERAALQKLSPEDRARRLLQRRNELIREGKLKDDSASPASAPASQPVKSEPKK